MVAEHLARKNEKKPPEMSLSSFIMHIVATFSQAITSLNLINLINFCNTLFRYSAD
jgi:hypothetical protein